jgi:hypothetical protein
MKIGSYKRRFTVEPIRAHVIRKDNAQRQEREPRKEPAVRKNATV